MTDKLTTPLERALRQLRQHGGPRWARRRFLIGVCVMALAAAGAAAAILPAVGAPSTGAASVLNRLASRVVDRSWALAPGQYVYRRTEAEWGTFYDNRCVTRSVEENESWLGADGSGLQREIKRKGSFTSPADRALCRSMAARNHAERLLSFNLRARRSDTWSAPNCMAARSSNWSHLSTDPQTLLREIDQLYHARNPSPSERFSYVEDLLGQHDPPPDVQANIYRAAALIPGVRYLGTVRDHAGRLGSGFSVPTPFGTSELIFDDQTGELLSKTNTGRFAGWSIYIDEKVVDALPSKPPVPLVPACRTTGRGRTTTVPNGFVMTGAP